MLLFTISISEKMKVLSDKKPADDKTNGNRSFLLHEKPV